VDLILLPYLQATDESERQQHLDDILVVHGSPVVRQAMRRKLGFYVDPRGMNPHNQDAEDLYQEIMTKIVQALHDLRNTPAGTGIENFKQYVARIASNSCNDVLRAKSPARARLKNNLRFLLTHHRDLAVWNAEGVSLAGFAGWRDSSSATSSERQPIDSEERVAKFRSSRFPKANIKEVPLAKLVAELFEWIHGPIELDALVNTVAMLLDVRDDPIQSVDDDPDAIVEARIADSTLRARSRLEEQALLRSLWQALQELSAEQRTFSASALRMIAAGICLR
jgi:RNA polymerase sigma factor (sigma-70 family)